MRENDRELVLAESATIFPFERVRCAFCGGKLAVRTSSTEEQRRCLNCGAFTRDGLERR